MLGGGKVGGGCRCGCGGTLGWFSRDEKCGIVAWGERGRGANYVSM